MVRTARARESGSEEKFDVFSLSQEDVSSKAAPGSRWALTWEMVHGRMYVKARLPWPLTWPRVANLRILRMAWFRHLVA